MIDDDIKEMNRIKDRLRAALDVKALKAVADDEREVVQKFAANPETKELAIQISNLKSYLLNVELPAKEKRRNS
tara:strand:- start:1351 stop:1572 length:222 start_codon:yes stop_codon:yes gene_type:complete